MSGFGRDDLFFDALWFLVIVGWIVLIMTGLEADKPLSGGLPGHVDYGEAHGKQHWSSTDEVGEIAGWVVFGLAAASLPIILYWIFNFHAPPR